MTDAAVYEYNLAGRRPMVLFALAASFAMAGFGWVNGAPWYFMLPVALAGVMAAVGMIANPQSGVRLTADTLHFYNRGEERAIPVADIASATFENPMDGGVSARLTLISGDKIAIPALSIDRDFEAALASVGVNIDRV